MTAKKLEKLRRRIGELRGQGGIKQGELVRLAEAVGRRPDKRGKEGTWVNDERGWFPLTIPKHKTVNKFTARAILDRLEVDVDWLEEHLDEVLKDA